MPKQTWALLVSAAAGAAFETVAVLELAAPPHLLQLGPALRVVLLHFAACAFFAPGLLALVPSGNRLEKSVALLLIFGFSCALPVLGPALALGFSQLIRRLPPATGLEKRFYFGENPYLTDPNERAAFDKTTRSIIEILNSPNTEARRKAILAVRSLSLQAAVPILRHAQQDNDEQVRIFARNSLAQIIAALESALKSVEGKLLESEQGIERMTYVIEQYHQFVELGLISEGTRTIYLTQALSVLNKIHEREPANEKILCLLVKYCISNNRLNEARQRVAKLKELSRDSASTLPWELEISFVDRDWRALHTVLEKLRREHQQDPRLRELYAFWFQRQQPISAA
jgi:hypothetical protein